MSKKETIHNGYKVVTIKHDNDKCSYEVYAPALLQKMKWQLKRKSKAKYLFHDHALAKALDYVELLKTKELVGTDSVPA